jgi:CubicO group peptidase (beta-lactamase class C family)
MVPKPYFSPGQGWPYSNTDYILPGMIINRATGNPLSKEFRDRFCKPVGLNRTSLDAEETITGQSATFWVILMETEWRKTVQSLVERGFRKQALPGRQGGFSPRLKISRGEPTPRFREVFGNRLCLGGRRDFLHG